MMFDCPIHIPNEEEIDENASPDLNIRFRFMKAWRKKNIIKRK